MYLFSNCVYTLSISSLEFSICLRTIGIFSFLNSNECVVCPCSKLHISKFLFITSKAFALCKLHPRYKILKSILFSSICFNDSVKFSQNLSLKTQSSSKIIKYLLLFVSF